MLLKQALFSLFCLVLLAWTGNEANGQVLVYRMETERVTGVNYHVFERGCMVVPLLGGPGTFILTTIDGGRSYLTSPDGGRLFVAVEGDKRRAVISAVTGQGSAHGTFVAMGEINESVRISSPEYHLTAKVARTLKGTAVSADDENEAEEGLLDENNVGSAGIADVKFILSERETDRANRDGLSVELTVERLILELERQGYVNVGEGDDDGDDEDELENEVMSDSSMELNLRGAEVTTEDLLTR